jgi:hypothetical protein
LYFFFYFKVQYVKCTHRCYIICSFGALRGPPLFKKKDGVSLESVSS